MKKILSIIVIVIIVILLTLIILPFAFKGKILEVAKKEVNKSMNAQIDFDHLGLNFFKSFPNATVSLENFYIAGINEFEGDTLLMAQKLSATVNVKSLFGDTGYEIIKVSADNAKVHAIILEYGKANWEIIPEDEVKEDNETNEDAGNFNLQLKQVSINNVDIIYDDRASKMNAELKDLNVNLSGDMTAEETTIKTNLTIDELSFLMDKIPYLSKAKTQAKIDLIANLKDMKFTLADNNLQINEIKANIDGWVAMHEDESIEMDLKLNAPTTQFKDVLSMIPVIYAKDFKDLKTSGQATLEASLKGVMKGEDLPAFDAKLNVTNAMFQYPGMPKSVTDINTNLRAYSKGGSMDNTIVDISKFHFEMGDNPFDLTLHLSNPISDMNISLSAVGKLNLGMVKEIYPLEDMELSGKLDANMKLQTRMSYIEKEQYDKVEAAGNLNIQDMLVKSEEMDDIQIQNAHLGFSPRYVDLSNFSAQIGKNNITAQGKLENFIPYFMKDETLKGNLIVKSNYLNLNDFMAEEESEATTDTTSTIGIIEIPKNLEFNLNGNFNQVIFDNLDMKNVVGQIIIKDGKVDLKNVSVNALGGQLKVNGYYDTGKNPKQPDVAMDLDIKEASFAQTFSTFVTIQKLAPIFENMLGNYSTSFKMNTALGNDFMPILSSITASGLLQSNNVEITNVPVLDGLASTLKNESLKDLKVKDLKLPFTIDDGRVATKPFDINFGSGTMNLSGSTGLDQTIDYFAKINLSEKLSNNYLKSVSVKIGGTFNQPKFSIDTKDAAGQLLDNLTSSLLGGDKTIDSAKENTVEKINDQVEKQIENLRTKAKNTGDKLISEAEKQGQKLIDEANKTSNPIAKIAAVKAAESGAKKLKEEAEKKAKELNDEAEKQIQSLNPTIEPK
ncbi:AsmA-like C-terminal region-containing protein [Bacteroidales bacterium OttesenSCG-928-M06]|nr:AsmA-like C-terminal region-containing protein [Bacteroidales bacterium OttesenSCG-928-M06]